MGVIRRLRHIQPAELRFRSREAAWFAAEAVEYALGRATWRPGRLAERLRPDSQPLAEARRALRAHEPRAAHEALRVHFGQRAPRFVIDPRRATAVADAIRTQFPGAATAAAARGQRLLAGRHDLLGYTDLPFHASTGNTDWHLDPVHGRRAPAGFWRRVPFLDPGSGDHKIIWELNRHQHWLAFGRAAWLTGDREYRDAFAAELRSWLRANPPLEGVNWASMLELAFRSLSWIWALHFFVAVEEDAETPPWLVDLLHGLERQLEHIARHLSVYFSPNTHLLGEGLALYVAGSVLPEFDSAPRWATIGRRVLLHEARAQVHADGGHAELSAHYHRYALDFYLLALAVARVTSDPAAETFASVASGMATFCRRMADDTGRLPTIGDDDGGMLFPMCGRPPFDASDSLSLAASLLDRPELAVGEPPEEAIWMLGGDRERLVRGGHALPGPPSVLFPDTGYAVLRSGRAHGILDAGPHGFLNGGHAHADALSLVLTVDRRPLLIDPGTATYTIDRSLRDRFRSTPMHNTLVIDGRPQSIPSGPFHWRTRARGRVEVWRAAPEFTYVEASHDGYAPLEHRRAVLVTPDGVWIVADHLLGDGRHQVDAYWHLAPGSPQDWMASTASETRHYHGDHEGLGWSAPVFGQLVPSPTRRASTLLDAPGSLVTAFADDLGPLTIEPLAVEHDPGDAWHYAGVSVRRADRSYLAIFGTPRPGVPAGAPARHAISRGGRLVSDARVTLLRLSAAGEPQSVLWVDGSVVRWTGPSAFVVERRARETDLHLDLAAPGRLSRTAGAQLG